VFTFATREVAEVMVPAPDVVWLDAALDVEEALSRARSARHSRYPVGRGTLDEMVGLVHLRDLAAAARERPGVRVEAITRPAPIVPETKDLGALLRELREARQQMAVVLDEYGNTAGWELPDATIERIDEWALRVAGSMTIDDFNEALGTSLPQQAVRTLAGRCSMRSHGCRPWATSWRSRGCASSSRTSRARIRRLRVELPESARESPPA